MQCIVDGVVAGGLVQTSGMKLEQTLENLSGTHLIFNIRVNVLGLELSGRHGKWHDCAQLAD